MTNDYSELTVRIDLVPQGEPILDKFRYLRRYKEFDPEMADIDKVIRYVVLCYDVKSPLQKLDNLGQKKATAAQEAGFPFEDGVFQPEIVAMMDNMVLEINKMIIRYCRIQQSRLYALIVSGNEAFHDATLNLLSNSENSGDALKDVKTKMEIFDKAKANAIALDQMSREFLSNDTSLNMQKTLYTIIDNNDSEIPLTPEDFAL